MSDTCAQENSEAILKRRITRFLKSDAVWKRPLRSTLERIEKNQWNAVAFGGVLRDLMIFGGAKAPRDIDIVVDVDPALLEVEFRDILLERNRFGGLRLRIKGWIIDIWSLENTWAFRQALKVNPSFDQLVTTTFLNVEAVAAALASSKGIERPLYHSGFFEALDKKILDISFEENPFPALAVVRSLITAVKLGFNISPRLASYILNQSRINPLTAFVNAQEKHYGTVRLTERKLANWFAAIEKQMSTSHNLIRLPVALSEQLEMTSILYPSC